MKVAALYVETGGCYYGLPDVDPWDIERDARLYDGPWPVVAHPPCARWGNLWWSARHLGKGLGDDDGCFEAALAVVRKYGGVLEHPAQSRAWQRFNLPRPGPSGWQGGLFDPGWSAEVYQRNYGHRALKRTWLYYVGPRPPSLDWRTPADADCVVEHQPPKERRATPLPFRDLLLEMARTAGPTHPTAAPGWRVGR